MKERIIILNDGLGPNKGDQSILISMHNALRRSIPEVKITVLPYSWKITGLWNTLHAIGRSDLVLLGGGQVLHDQTSAAFLLLVLSKVTLARIFRKRIMGYAIGTGPLETKLGKFLTKIVMNQAELIAVRVLPSKELLESLGVTKPPVHVTADASFTLPASAPARVAEILKQEDVERDGHLMVAIAPRRWFHYHHRLVPVRYSANLWRSRRRGGARFNRCKEAIAQAADRLVADRGVRIVFVPMRCSRGRIDPSQDDDTVSQEIYTAMHQKQGAHLLKGNYTPQELKGIFGRMDAVLGMRMHSLIMAAGMEVPVVGIDISPKFAPLFQALGQEEYLLPVEELTRDKLLHKIESVWRNRKQIKKRLSLRVRELEEQASATATFVSGLLRKD